MLFDQVSKDIVAAMKAKDKVRLEALRNIKKVFIEAKTATKRRPSNHTSFPYSLLYIGGEWHPNKCCKDSANERHESLLSNGRVQPILCKDTKTRRNEKKRAR